jgi:hypothetical protein
LCLFSLLGKNASFLDLKGVVSVNDTFVPNMPFVHLDLLILLLYYYECGSMQLIFRPNHDKKTVKSKIWDICKTTCVLG